MHIKGASASNLLPGRVLLHPGFKQGTQTTVPFASRVCEPGRVSGRGMRKRHSQDGSERCPSPPQLRQSPRAWVETRWMERFQEKAGFQPQQEAGVGGSQEGGPCWSPVDFTTCRVTRQVQLGTARSHKSSALHRARSAERQSPLTASCKCGSPVSERPPPRPWPPKPEPSFLPLFWPLARWGGREPPGAWGWRVTSVNRRLGGFSMARTHAVWSMGGCEG